MKYEMGSNDSLPFIEVVTDGNELVVRFWGFGYEEAEKWTNSNHVMESLEIWHSVVGDFEMSVKLNERKCDDWE